MSSIDVEILNSIVKYYLESRDFNGTAISKIDGSVADLISLIESEKISILWPEIVDNTHIIRVGFPPIEQQLSYINTNRENLKGCAYPTKKVLRQVVNVSKYTDYPYNLELALGSPQLSYKVFDLTVLERYRNDPRYHYDTNDSSGKICITDEYFESDKIPESDQILLQSFGFAYDDDFNRYVAVFNRYLRDLTSEHQKIWKLHEVTVDAQIHPGYYRSAVAGDWPEKIPLTQAICLELYNINKICELIGRPNLFRIDYGEYGEGKPKGMSFLLRPTQKEINESYLLIDKHLSDNISKKFFGDDIPTERDVPRSDGKVVVQQLGTILLLDEWIRENVELEDWSAWDEAIATFRNIRKKRQRPAHSVDEDSFDQEIFKEQRLMLVSSCRALRTLRLILEGYAEARGLEVEISSYVREGKIWSI